jgi:HSP20 family protein
LGQEDIMAEQVSKQTQAEQPRQQAEGAMQTTQTNQSVQGAEAGANPAHLTREGRQPQPLASAGHSPFTLMRRMMEDMERMFDNIGLGTGFPSFSGTGLSRFKSLFGMELWTPEVEVQQRDGSLIVRADLPGLKPEDIQLEVQDGALLLRGERRREQQSERSGLSYSERSYGSFTRTIAIPRGVGAEDVDAKFEHGVLEVSVKLPQQPRPRTVQIRTESDIAATSNSATNTTPTSN